jgi:Ser-tRNA(Ala) deacylase AlaX
MIDADAGGIRLDRTVFYPIGGGQPGDTPVVAGIKLKSLLRHPGEGRDPLLGLYDVLCLSSGEQTVWHLIPWLDDRSQNRYWTDLYDSLPSA